jgi:hypothetical protein
MFQPGVKSEKATEKAYFSHRGETSGKCSSTAANLKQHQQMLEYDLLKNHKCTLHKREELNSSLGVKYVPTSRFQLTLSHI